MRMSEWSAVVCYSDLQEQRAIYSEAHCQTGQGCSRGMFLSRRNWVYVTALLLTAALATAATAAGGEAVVDERALYEKTQWRKSDGWANSWSKNDTGWVGRHIAIDRKSTRLNSSH